MIPDNSVRRGEKEYTLIAELGRGVNGVVYRAERNSDHLEVALKRMDNVVDERRLLDEFDIMKNLSALTKVGGEGCRVGVVCYYDLFYTVENGKKVYWLVLEYIPGYDMFHVLTKSPHGLAVEELLKFMKYVLYTIDYIHSKGASHLDLKPDNIRASTDGLFYIVDFGFVCMPPRWQCAATGSPRYMAPELFVLRSGAVKNLAEEAFPEADIWSLGVTFLELASGRTLDRYWPPPERNSFMEEVIESARNNEEPPEVPREVFALSLKKLLLHKDLHYIAKVIQDAMISNYVYRPSARELYHRLENPDRE